MEKETPITLGAILKISPLVLAFITMILWCGNLNAKVSAQETRLATVEVRQAKYDDNYNQLNLQVSERLGKIETILSERLPAKK